MGKRCLVALDTDHIKHYVFATDKLKEIRGASSILDHLNRRVMERLAKEYQARPVYMNGGSGLFLIEAGEKAANQFGKAIQDEYRERTQGGASITYAVQDIPDSVKNAWTDDISDTLELLRFGLAQKKEMPPDHIALVSHPFLRVCDACGSRYAETPDDSEDRDPQDSERRYCAVCMGKRKEDTRIKKNIKGLITQRKGGNAHFEPPLPYAWQRILSHPTLKGYNIPEETRRPQDFDELRGSADGKDYLALIYADGNNMGQKMSSLRALDDIQKLAQSIDDAVYDALAEAIRQKLPVNEETRLFPFDILMIGGDDVMIATSASVALDVACTLASTFYERTKDNNQDCSLSVGVVLAPVKYPFGPLHDLAESTLRFAKKEGASRRAQRDGAKASATEAKQKYGDSLLNFITVTGSTSPSFKRVYDGLHARRVPYSGGQRALYATLRPYTVDGMQELLVRIRQGKDKRLGRTKLHQIREAVLRMNLSTSVFEGMAVLRNWSNSTQRDFVRNEVCALANRHKDQATPERAPGMFTRATFPWVADGANVFRTALFDYVELYDYVSLEKADADALSLEREEL